MTPERAELLFHVSGHGFGHARRTARVIAAVHELAPGLSLRVRTTAPTAIFTSVGLIADQVQPTGIDGGIVEKDAGTVDAKATVERTLDLLDRKDAIIREEVEALARSTPSLIVADVPFLAGDVAAALGVPCVASGNFTWDWIFRPMLAGHARGGEVLEAIGASYRRMSAVLRHPFSHEMPQFERVVDIPAVAHPAAADRRQTLRRLKLDPSGRQPRVLLAMRGGSSPETLLAGVRSCPHLLFTTTQPLPPGAPPNLRQLHLGDIDFADAMALHDAVISKLGYGIVCDALAAGTRLLWPRRSGFREDELFERDAPRLLPMVEIPRDDYAAGRWGPWLDRLLATPLPTHRPRVDGAEVTARHLLAMLGGGSGM